MLFVQDRSGELAFFTVLFDDDLWKELKKWMFPNKKTANFSDYKNGDIAAYHGYFTLIKHNKNLVFTSNAIDYATEAGHLKIIKYLHNRGESCTKYALDVAIKHNRLDIVKFLYINRDEGYSLTGVLDAIDENHVKTLGWLHNNAKEKDKNFIIGICQDYGHDYATRYITNC